jgi:predicted nuclease of predicted toxin-antitoxin system
MTRSCRAPDVAVLDAAIAAGRALVTLDLDFANPIRFPPRRTPGIAVLRVRDRPGRRDLDLVVSELIQGLSQLALAGHLWVAEPGRIRQYQEDPDDDEW